jgi:glucokinase
MPSQLCRATVDMLLCIFGAEAGNLVPKVFATVVGTWLKVSPDIRSTFLKEPRLMQAFLNEERFKDLMRRIPVHVITVRAALVVAITYGLETLQRTEGRA